MEGERETEESILLCKDQTASGCKSEYQVSGDKRVEERRV